MQSSFNMRHHFACSSGTCKVRYTFLAGLNRISSAFRFLITGAGEALLPAPGLNNGEAARLIVVFGCRGGESLFDVGCVDLGGGDAETVLCICGGCV